MKKNYDFSKGEKNPYFRKLKGKALKLTEEISFELADLVKLAKTKKITRKKARPLKSDRAKI
jgi:hypothetical protein